MQSPEPKRACERRAWLLRLFPARHPKHGAPDGEAVTDGERNVGRDDTPIDLSAIAARKIRQNQAARVVADMGMSA